MSRWLERRLYYGPTQSFPLHIDKGFLERNDFVRYDGGWAKIRRISDEDGHLTTEDGKTVYFKSPGEDFRYSKRSEHGGALFALMVALVVGLLGAAATLGGAWFMVRNTPSPPPCPACPAIPACPAPPAPSGPVIVQ